MSSPYGKQIEDLMELYRRQREQIAETQQKLLEVSATATAPGRVVTITVGARGEVTSVTFPTQRYRKMAPAELATVLVSTISEARAQAAEETTALMANLFPGGLPMAFSDSLPPEPPDPEALFEKIMGQAAATDQPRRS